MTFLKTAPDERIQYRRRVVLAEDRVIMIPTLLQTIQQIRCRTNKRCTCRFLGLSISHINVKKSNRFTKYSTFHSRSLPLAIQSRKTRVRQIWRFKRMPKVTSLSTNDSNISGRWSSWGFGTRSIYRLQFTDRIMQRASSLTWMSQQSTRNGKVFVYHFYAC